MLTLLLLAAAAAVQAPAAGPSLQVKFEAASAALNAGKWAEAVTQFRAIEDRPTISRRTRAIVLMREGQALLHLQESDAARSALRRGVELAPKADQQLQNDRLDALLALGNIERESYDYAAAARDFEEARGLAGDPLTKVHVLLKVANTTMSEDQQAALKAADEAVSVVGTAKTDADVVAAAYDTRGRVLLNLGRYDDALADLQVALKHQGGLTSRTDLNDVAVRSDLALAALKAKKLDKAREYLAMTGEGRLPDGPFATPADTDVPACGGDIGPDDVVVVQFGIADDGHVAFATPVYASRPGPMALEFARSVSGWQWRAADVKSIPAFYRILTRIELRCSNAIRRPADPELLQGSFTAWLETRGAPLPTGKSALQLHAALAQLPAGSVERAAYLYAFAVAPAADHQDAVKALSEAVAIGRQEHAPVGALTFLRLCELTLRTWDQHGSASYRKSLREMLADPAVIADPQSLNVARLMLASPAVGVTPDDAGTLLQQVADDRRLNPQDPLRVGALVRLASLQAKQGNIEAARTTYARSGVAAQQCALVDATPVMRRSGLGSSDYPRDALFWGMGGWVQAEFDILPDGQTTRQRAVMSFPPFVFDDATIKGFQRARFEQSYRPDGQLGCTAATRRARYLMQPHS